MFEQFLKALFVTAWIGIGLLLVFAVTAWLSGWQLPALTPRLALDIGMGVVCLVWLLLILTVPWDIHFKARAVQFELERSRDAGLTVSDERLTYVKRTQRTTLWVALGLHVFSAIVVGGLTHFTHGSVGYWFAGFYLVTMVFRPFGAAYEYLHRKLSDIGEEARFPRDDTLKLKSDLAEVRAELAALHSRMAQVSEELSKLTSANAKAHQDILALQSAIERAEQSFKSRIGQMSDEIERALSRTFDQQDIVNGLRAFARLIKSA
uniref:Uncharacterized protein n=1 Tax=Chloracidobacterium thermophilum TaxID=458033 RepID=A8DJL5_9BACT|nr:hypothetical protein YS_M60-F11.108 [Chloracidobacterium thermophilum]